MADILHSMLIVPIEYLMDMIAYRTYEVFGETVITLMVLSVCVNVITMPLYREAERLGDEEKKRQDDMQAGKEHIMKSFKGDERSMVLDRYYRKMQYHPIYALRSTLSLLLQIPFFMAAYEYISQLRILQRVGAWGIQDLAMEDGLIHLMGQRINLLPILMTVINILSVIIYLKGKGSAKKYIQPVVIACIFLVLLYHSPSGLVLYWIFNNVISLIRNIYRKYIQNKKLFIVGCMSMLPILYIYHDALAMEKADWLTGYNNYFLLICTPLIVYLVYLCVKKFIGNKHFTVCKASATLKDMIPVLLTLTVLLGAVIPLEVISAAPWDFTGTFAGTDPRMYFNKCFLVYFGVFVIWGTLLFLVLKKYRNAVYMVLASALFVFVANHFLNAGRFGFISVYLFFDMEPNPSVGDKLMNLLALAAVLAIVMYILKRFPRVLGYVTHILLIAGLFVTVKDYLKISEEVKKDNGPQYVEGTDAVEEALLALDKNEKNVIVVMLDRTISSYIPWIFEEKKQLKEQFDGFTYYPDTLSFAGKTIIATVPLYGGYEYMPEHINERDTETLMDKHNEALRVMPVLFGRNGMDVTVADLSYGNYENITDLSIYDEDENVKAIYLEKRFGVGDVDIKNRQLIQDRMFVFYSVFDVMPLCFSKQLYDRGNYQSVFGREHDMYANFVAPYLVLDNLPNITEITDDGRGKVIIMANNTTHDVMDLQLPDYTPQALVDNSAYKNMERYNDKGEKLVFTSSLQDQLYKIDMAGMLKMGEYFDFMREQGVYDNTRIILVSDHGNNLDLFEDFMLFDGRLDIARYNPLLMVKDFDSHGFTTSDEFMTDADVPILALHGVVEEMVNPFTGKELTDEEKRGELHISASAHNDGVSYISKENTMFDTSDAPWYAVHDSIFDRNNWSIWKEQGDRPSK